VAQGVSHEFKLQYHTQKKVSILHPYNCHVNHWQNSCLWLTHLLHKTGGQDHITQRQQAREQGLEAGKCAGSSGCAAVCKILGTASKGKAQGSKACWESSHCSFPRTWSCTEVRIYWGQQEGGRSPRTLLSLRAVLLGHLAS
jgi:hypothetical protein